VLWPFATRVLTVPLRTIRPYAHATAALKEMANSSVTILMNANRPPRLAPKPDSASMSLVLSNADALMVFLEMVQHALMWTNALPTPAAPTRSAPIRQARLSAPALRVLLETH